MRPMHSFFRLGLFSTLPGIARRWQPRVLERSTPCPCKTSRGCKSKPIVTGLDTPWDIAWGPDGQIWVTERGGRVSRVNPSTGQRTTAGQVPEVSESGESGLMGIAFHPDFSTQPFVYVAHSYLQSGALAEPARAPAMGRADR